MAGPSGRRGGATGHNPDRDPDEWSAAFGTSSLRLALRAIQRDAYFRRPFGKRLEPAESAGETVPSHATQWSSTSDGNRLEPGWASLFLSPEKHESEI